MSFLLGLFLVIQLLIAGDIRHAIRHINDKGILQKSQSLQYK